MKLITEVLDDVRYITEQTEDKGKKYFIEGTFLMAEIANRNKRMYSRDVLAREVDRYKKDYIDQNRAFGELGHPDSPTIHLDRVSHMITSLDADKNNFYGRARILDTPFGNIVKNIIDAGGKLGVSSRGMGSLKPGPNGVNLVQDDFTLATAADIVADPSAPDAFVRGLRENKDWMFIEGKFVEQDIDDAKQKINKATRKQIESVAVSIFENFLRKL